MKEITSKKNEVYLRGLRRYAVRHVTTHIIFYRELQYFSEGVDWVLSPDRVAFQISNVIIGGEKNSDGILRNYINTNTWILPFILLLNEHAQSCLRVGGGGVIAVAMMKVRQDLIGHKYQRKPYNAVATSLLPHMRSVALPSRWRFSVAPMPVSLIPASSLTWLTTICTLSHTPLSLT
jgi:hypothetical protein